MFNKPFKVKSETVLKGSDRKRMKLDITQQLGLIDNSFLSELIPQKGNILQTKVQLHNGDAAILIMNGKEPIFFMHEARYYPTVYTCWKYPDMLFTFRTWPIVIERIFGGADFMLPGVVFPGLALDHISHIRMGQALGIHTTKNRSVVALGEACMSGESMFNSNMRGKGIKIKHFYGDQLWMMGSKAVPPEIPDSITVVDSEATVSISDQTSEAAGDSGGLDQAMAAASLAEEIKYKNVGEEIITVNSCKYKTTNSGGLVLYTDEEAAVEKQTDMEERTEERKKTKIEELQELSDDEKLYQCFLYALKRKLKPTHLPIMVPNFHKEFVLACCPHNVTLDIKKTKYKKVLQFLLAMQKEKFITVKEQSKGVHCITDFNQSHDDVQCFRPWSLADQPEPEPVEITPDDYVYTPPVIKELLSINAQTLPLFSRMGFSKGDVVEPSQIRSIVTEYIKREQLQDKNNKQQVLMDKYLTMVLVKKSDGYREFMTWNDIFSRLPGLLSAVYQIHYSHGAVITKKGKPQSITLQTATRTGNKKVTLVHHIDKFGIDLKVLAGDIKSSKACSTSITETKDGFQLLAQGNHASFICSLLKDKYKIPQKYLQNNS